MRPQTELTPRKTLRQQEQALRGLVKEHADRRLLEEWQLDDLESRWALGTWMHNEDQHLLLRSQKRVVLLWQLKLRPRILFGFLTDQEVVGFGERFDSEDVGDFREDHLGEDLGCTDSLVLEKVLRREVLSHAVAPFEPHVFALFVHELVCAPLRARVGLRGTGCRRKLLGHGLRLQVRDANAAVG